MIITKRPGSVDRPSPERLFTTSVLRDIGKRDEKILETDIFIKNMS